jgi:RNA polymerase sigma-70 factor (ECF subfamily)
MDEKDFLAERFEAQRGHLRSVAYRMLGSLSEADDAVQEAWLKLSRADTSEVENLGGWLTTEVGRVCLNMLRSRGTRREAPLEVFVPDPVISDPAGVDPEQEVLLADSVGVALLVVLETLSPAERLAFVLHDLFAVPFEEIAPVVGRSAAATRQLASRARRRVRGAAPLPDVDMVRQREVVEAFLVAARGGDFQGLLTVLDPDVMLRSDGGALLPSSVVRGAENVAGGAVAFAPLSEPARRVLVNGLPGAVVFEDGRLASVASFTVANGKIIAVDLLTDPERLALLDLSGIAAG